MNFYTVLWIILLYHLVDIFVRAFMGTFYLTPESRLEKRVALLEKNFSESTLGCYDNEDGVEQARAPGQDIGYP